MGGTDSITRTARLTCLAVAALLGCELQDRADLDRNGYVDVADLDRVERCALAGEGPEGPGCESADVNLDGRVDGADVETVEERQGAVLIDPSLDPRPPDDVFLGPDDTLYFFSSDRGSIDRWSLRQDRRLAPIPVRPGAIGAGVSPSNRLQVTYANGRIALIDADLPIREETFLEIESPLIEVFWVGALLHVVTEGFYAPHGMTYRPDGTPAHDASWYNVGTQGWTLEPNSGRLFFVHSPTNLQYSTFDPVSGNIRSWRTIRPDTVIDLDMRFHPSKDGSRVILASGVTLDLDSATVVARAEHPLSEIGTVLSSGEFVGLERVPSGTIATHYGVDLRRFGGTPLPGRPVAILEWTGGLIAVTHDPTGLALHALALDPDADGDGIPNVDDRFALDAAASIDDDRDGAPDRWNPGFDPETVDTDLILDAFVDDPTCWLIAHGHPRRPEECDPERSVPESYTLDDVVVDGEGVVYYLSREDERVYRWNFREEEHLLPVPIDPDVRVLGTLRRFGGVYAGYGDGRIDRLDRADRQAEWMPFVSLDVSVFQLVDLGDALLAISGRSNPEARVMQSDGTILSSQRLNGSHGGAAFADDAKALFQGDSIVRRYSLDEDTGIFGDRLWLRSTSVATPFDVSADGRRFVDANGVLRSGENGDVLAVLPVPAPIVRTRFGPANETVVLTSDGDGRALVLVWDVDLNLVDMLRADGQPLDIVRVEDGFLLVSNEGRPRAEWFELMLDRDGDGVPTTLDAFPLDARAAIDTDRDGAPDAWVDGIPSASLTLDRFPDDSACQAAEDARPDDPSRCDTDRVIPAYQPSAIDVADDGTIYLLSTEAERVFRWSGLDGRYLDPIVIRGGATMLRWSESADALYVAYADGLIERIANGESTMPREVFVRATSPATLMETSGDFLYLADGWSISSLDQEGRIVSEMTRTAFSLQGRAVLHAASNRFVTIDLNSLWNVFSWFEIDPETGAILETRRDRPANQELRGLPLRLSSDGRTILTGNGLAFDAESFAFIEATGVEFTDATHLWNDHLLSIRTHEDGTRVARHSRNFTEADARWLPGRPQGVFRTGSRIWIVTSDEDGTRFSEYVYGVDGDNDGVPYARDAFPLDAAASKDTDADGAPDVWNPGAGPADSTSGLHLDDFPLSAACQTEQDTPDASSACVPGPRGHFDYRPRAIAGPKGEVFLFDPDDDRIERYDLAERRYVDPIPVEPGALDVAYSPRLGRLFLSYGDGRIDQFFVRVDFPRAKPFAHFPGRVESMVAVNDVLFVVQRASLFNDYWTVDSQGRILSRWRAEQATPSGNAASQPDGRLYLQGQYVPPWTFVVVRTDPESGRIETVEEADHPNWQRPYFLEGFHASEGGRYLLNGGGTILDRSSLAFVARLPTTFEHAVWTRRGPATLGSASTHESELSEWGVSGALFERTPLAGWPFGLFSWRDSLVAFTNQWGEVRITFVEASVDADGDGVANELDAFPRDAAASVDVDEDGWPDRWNPGRDSGDSVSGLVLDAWPNDAACQRPEHGLDDRCDFLSVWPVDETGEFCEADRRRPPSTSGITPPTVRVRAFEPLCDGWMIAAERHDPVALVVNAFDGRVAWSQRLDADAERIVLDRVGRRIVVRARGGRLLEFVDVVTRARHSMSMYPAVEAMAFDEAGNLYLLDERRGLHRMPAGSDTLEAVESDGTCSIWFLPTGAALTKRLGAPLPGARVLCRLDETGAFVPDRAVEFPVLNGGRLFASDFGAVMGSIGSERPYAPYGVVVVDATDPERLLFERTTLSTAAYVDLDPMGDFLLLADEGTLSLIDLDTGAPVEVLDATGYEAGCSRHIEPLNFARDGSVAWAFQRCSSGSRFLWIERPDADPTRRASGH